ncbi:MAG: FMN-binding negative transcriptional regulator [Acidobacteriota bacterium]|nr:FMN-binding negative transcriptional regulator [Acidobacteriota bacterium]
MRAHSFATLVSMQADQLVATHLPFVIHESENGAIKLSAHMAKANEHWKAIEGREALTIFMGPHGYVSPALYESKLSVPTWNYAAVHAYGTARLVATGPVLDALIDEFDPAYQKQWDELPEDFKTKMTAGIVAFEITVDKLEGKYKFSQNRPKIDRASVAAAYVGTELGDLMTRALKLERAQ